MRNQQSLEPVLPGMYYPEQSADRLPPSTAPGDFAETFRTFPRYLSAETFHASGYRGASWGGKGLHQ